MSWRIFIAAALSVAIALFMAGAPLFAIAAGIAGAALINYRKRKKSGTGSPSGSNAASPKTRMVTL
jgi:hypothetical protein